ncbi:MAG: hypothetical protein IKN24_10250 [Lachnospiraceae bacterium]|nr:hypothetical protein [Lachnospiraceae bacterium]
MDIKDIASQVAGSVSKDDVKAVADKAVEAVKREVDDVQKGQNIKDSVKDVVKDVSDTAMSKFNK